MAYQELVKNFRAVRAYLREFYVYGFKSREDYDGRSARSYDNERRRLESWLGEHMGFRRTPEGKNVFLSIDSRLPRHNPLFRAWRAKSFTDGDITLHFLLFDILHDPGEEYSLREIMAQLDEYARRFPEPRVFEPSTVRKKLAEYAAEGLIRTRKEGKALVYSRMPDHSFDNADALDFFAETAPCGVIGSFLLDRLPEHRSRFAFKHHYITGAMDSDIACDLLRAMHEQRAVTLETATRSVEGSRTRTLVPLRIFLSVRSGRQYLMGYDQNTRRIRSVRLDYIESVTLGETCPDFDRLRRILTRMQPHLWGVSTQGSGRMERVSFTVNYRDDEAFIHRRLEREKRCGTVERLDDHTSRFTAEVYDATELIPWMRTFLCRITEFSFSDPALEKRFARDLAAMYQMYGEGGEDA